MANIKSFPNNQDTYVGAEEVMRWLHGRTSGVFAAADNAAVYALDEPGMAVTVTDGVGWIANEGKDGVVWWNDKQKTTGSRLYLGIDIADAALNRIDRIIVEWKTTNYVDYPEIKVLKGTASSAAVPPALTNNNTLRQISLARIAVNAGITEITAGMITDERLDSSVCGLVTEALSVDTGPMQAQFGAFLKHIQTELLQLEAGTAVELKKMVFANVSVAASAFVSDSTYTDYPYRAAVALEGVIASMLPQVVFGVDALAVNSYAPVAECYDGGIYVYAASAPDESVTIRTIIIWNNSSGGNSGGDSGEDGAGEGLNIQIVSGTEKPESPDGTCIFVNTEQNITDYAIVNVDPTSPVAGKAYIVTNKAGTLLPLDKAGKLQLYLSECKIWVNKAWNTVDAWLYAGGKWTQFALEWDGYYLNGDNRYFQFTKGWYGNVSTGTFGVKITASNSSSWTHYFSTVKKLDLSNVDTLVFEVTQVANYNNCWASICVTSNYDFSGDILARKNLEDQKPGIYTLDVSSIDEGHIQIRVGNTSIVTVKSIRKG